MKNETFRTIEAAQEVGTFRTDALEASSPLTHWYKRVRDIPITDFGVGDLAKAVRQELYPDHVFPIALHALTRDPLAGDLYDGELLLSFQKIAGSFWKSHLGLARTLHTVCDRAIPSLSDDLRSAAIEMRERLEAMT